MDMSTKVHRIMSNNEIDLIKMQANLDHLKKQLDCKLEFRARVDELSCLIFWIDGEGITLGEDVDMFIKDRINFLTPDRSVFNDSSDSNK